MEHLRTGGHELPTMNPSNKPQTSPQCSFSLPFGMLSCIAYKECPCFVGILPPYFSRIQVSTEGERERGKQKKKIILAFWVVFLGSFLLNTSEEDQDI